MTTRNLSNLTGSDLEEARGAGLRVVLRGLGEAKLSGSPADFRDFCSATGWSFEELDLDEPYQAEAPAFLSRREYLADRDDR